jgi:hypothetical protein
MISESRHGNQFVQNPAPNLRHLTGRIPWARTSRSNRTPVFNPSPVLSRTRCAEPNPVLSRTGSGAARLGQSRREPEARRNALSILEELIDGLSKRTTQRRSRRVRRIFPSGKTPTRRLLSSPQRNKS